MLVALQAAVAELESRAPEEFAPLVREFAVLTERAGRLGRMLKNPDASVERATSCHAATVLHRSEAVLRRVGEPFDVGFDLAPSGLIGMPGDSLERIAMNLVRNARKSVASGGRIDVSLRAGRRDRDELPTIVLVVEDTGGGSKRSERGGLDLIVVHELVAWAGGQLHVTECKPSGWRVRCEFPEIFEE